MEFLNVKVRPNVIFWHELYSRVKKLRVGEENTKSAHDQFTNREAERGSESYYN